MASPAAGLPDAITAALPLNPYEQLEVARKVTAVAAAARASRLELEAAHLHQRLADRDPVATELDGRAGVGPLCNEEHARDGDGEVAGA
uniref:Uncharacterized protein n=1 Tax=Setaria italica TaxID=4555 RepID=K3XNR4_SETIT